MSAHTEYRPARITLPINRMARFVALTLLFVAFAAVAALGGYVYGKGDKRSEAAIATERDAAVRGAVTRAVYAKGAADKALRERIMARHVQAQRQEDLALMDRLLLKEQQAGDRRAAAAFDRGVEVGRGLAAGGASAQPRAKPHTD